MFSFERNVKIADPEGASSLLTNMKSVEAQDPQTVDLPSQGAGRDLALHPLDAVDGDRAIRRLPEGQAPDRTTR